MAKKNIDIVILICAIVLGLACGFSIGINEVNQAVDNIIQETYNAEDNATKTEQVEGNVQTEQRQKDKTGWVKVEEANILNEPSIGCNIIGTIGFNNKVQYYDCDDGWICIDYNGKDAYMHTKDISNTDMGYSSYDQYVLDEIIGYKSYTLSNPTEFKSFMDYRSITATGSPQYNLQNNYAVTGEYGIRMVDGRYCIAVGSHFTSNIGQYIDIILKNGTVIPCVLADQKSNNDTDGDNIVTVHNGCATEFIVDTPRLNSNAKQSGDISNCNDNWNSQVAEIKVYNKNVFNN